MNDEINISRFTETFPDEASCVAYLEKALWRDGIPVSPFGGGEACRVQARLGFYQCKKTLKCFSIKRATVFEKSRLPLRKWFLAIFLLDTSTRRINSSQLAKYLGVTQTTAGFVLQRVRHLRRIAYV